MWPFSFYETLSDSGLLVNSIDYHSHLLPGVDDGVGTMDETLEILENFEKQGISVLWLTPHIMEDIPNATNALKQRFSELLQVYEGGIQLHLAELRRRLEHPSGYGKKKRNFWPGAETIRRSAPFF